MKVGQGCRDETAWMQGSPRMDTRMKNLVARLSFLEEIFKNRSCCRTRTESKSRKSIPEEGTGNN